MSLISNINKQFVYFILISFFSCDIMNNDEAIVYYKEQIQKDSTILRELTKDINLFGRDSIQVSFLKAPRKELVEITKHGDIDIVENPIFKDKTYKSTLYRIIDLTSCTEYRFVDKSYVSFFYGKRNSSFEYFQLLYVVDWDKTINKFETNGYLIYENEYPQYCCKWLYKIDLKNNWALVSQ